MGTTSAGLGIHQAMALALDRGGTSLAQKPFTLSPRASFATIHSTMIVRLRYAESCSTIPFAQTSMRWPACTVALTPWRRARQALRTLFGPKAPLILGMDGSKRL